MPTPKPSKAYNIYMLTDHEKPVLWFPASTLAVQRRRLNNKATSILGRYGSHSVVKWEGPDVLHLYGRTWVTSFYIA